MVNTLNMLIQPITMAHSHAGYGTLDKCRWLSFCLGGISLGIGCFIFQFNFRVKRGYIAHSFITAVILIIMGLLKVLQLSAIYDPLWTDTIDWLNSVHIGFMQLLDHHKFLIFKMVLDLITTLRVVPQQDQITLWDGQLFSSSSESTPFCTFLMLFNAH